MITLAEAKVGMSDKIDQQVIDEFRRSSWLLDNLSFDDAVSPGTGGSTLAYGYVQLKTPSVAQFRALNTEYTKQQAIREEKTAYIKIVGGAYQLDRVIINTSGVVDELNFQTVEKVKGTVNLWHYTCINGDNAVNSNEFDGLDVLLTGASTEYNTAGSVDVSTSGAMDANYQHFQDRMVEFVSGMDATPSALLCNTQLATAVTNVARRSGYFSQIEDAFGRRVNTWDGIPIIDMRFFWDDAASARLPVIPIEPDGTTSLYAIELGLTGFHGISTRGSSIVESYLPDLNAPGVMKMGDVELLSGVVLKNTLHAGVFRNIKVTPSTVVTP